MKGADAFAVSGDYALFRGGYDDAEKYHLIELTQPVAKVRLRFQLRDRQGELIKSAASGGKR
ncbi:MAG: hypothetical protein EOP83_22820 [Verrucomicrobiaceae bacterium]|nr:MAG: hypothetical protein EOP83_22820 [Verrucomicrobiaceae bacterium]